MDGICTLANDRIYHQLIALLNSIEAIMGKDFPVCVYPYDDRVERIADEIAKRPNVMLFGNREVIDRWDNFVKTVWDAHPTARERWQKAGSTELVPYPSQGYHRIGTHRRYCAFEGPFERFLYMDGDTLLMSPVDFVFDRLNHHDCIVYDFQYKDPTHVYEVASPKLFDVFPQERVQSEIFCSGFYASKKGLFDAGKRDWLIAQLQAGEAEILYPMAPDQTIINYMMMRSSHSIYNFALQLPQERRTGCCVTSPHFEAQDNVLYDRSKRLTYIHYIGLSSSLFNELCEGENIDFPYRDIFLYYRYLNEPENCPQFTGQPKSRKQEPSFARRLLTKLGLNV